MNLFWNNLSKRQRSALLSGGIAILALLAVQFALLPFWEAKKTLHQAIKTREKTLGEMALLAAEYRTIKKHAEKIQQVLARRPQDFTLFSYMEKIAGKTGVKPHIKYINAAKGAVSGLYEEVPVEMKLEKITLRQLTDFLYILEDPQELIMVKRIAIAKMKETPEYLTAQIQAVTFQLAKVAGR